MAVPKRKISTARKGRRRAAIKLKLPNLVACSNCGEPKQRHQVCPNCGYYKGKAAVRQKTKKKER